MATQLFFRVAVGSIHRGTNSDNLAGVASGWLSRLLSTARGATATNFTTNTVAGTTLGVEIAGLREWISEPLAADVTISGTVTFNLWGLESSMSANVGFQVVVERLDHLGAVISTVVDSERGVELGTATSVHNWTAAPTSTSFQKGDRLRVRVAGNDVGTMASGFTFTFDYDSPTAGVTGDSYVSFTETFAFMTATPAGSTLYLTDVAGPAVGADIEKEMWTSRGSGVNEINTSTVVGWTAPIQATDSGGGTKVEWYSKPLAAFTLAERVLLNIRAFEITTAANASLRAELAVCNGDGSSAVVWAAANFNDSNSGELTTVEAAYVWHLAGDDLAVTSDQRLRLRVFLDDPSDVPMGSSVSGGHIFYDGTSGGASGDSFITLTQTVTVSAASFPPVPSVMVQRRMSAHLTM